MKSDEEGESIDAQKALKEHVDKHDFLRRDYDREKIYDQSTPAQPVQPPTPPQSDNTPPNPEPPQSADMKLPEGKAVEVDAPKPDVKYPEDSKTYTEEKIPEKSVETEETQPETKKTSGYTDVTQEYEEKATPGEGEITYDKDYNIKKHKEEVPFAKWLLETYGGQINLNAEIEGTKKSSNPDYIWNGKLWDLKTITTNISANSAVRHGFKQIYDERQIKYRGYIPAGGVMLDAGKNDVSIEELLPIIEERLQWYKEYDFDIMIVQNGKVLGVFRFYRKR